MKLNEQAKAALKEPGTRVTTFEMNEERRERYKRVSDGVLGLLTANTESPAEAYMLLQFIREGFEKAYDIRGGVIVEHGEKES